MKKEFLLMKIKNKSGGNKVEEKCFKGEIDKDAYER